MSKLLPLIGPEDSAARPVIVKMNPMAVERFSLPTSFTDVTALQVVSIPNPNPPNTLPIRLNPTRSANAMRRHPITPGQTAREGIVRAEKYRDR